MLIGAILCAIPGSAQNSNTGEIKGSVTDPSGAVVPGAAVSIKNVQTGVVTATTTNQSGLYDVPFLAPGNYTVTFSKEGFRNFVREGIVLQIETLEISGTLQIGTAAQEVVVNAAGPLVETETTEQHVDLSAPGDRHGAHRGHRLARRDDAVDSRREYRRGNGHGRRRPGSRRQRHAGIQYQLPRPTGRRPPLRRDFNSSNYYPPVDAISEVSINSGNAPAQYGNGLTSINVITKSGTNQFHGSAFEYVQNTALNARGFYNTTGPKSVEHWNEYGGSIGGPVMKNKLFFFFAYQRNPSSTPTSGLYSYPTAAMEAGDFYGIQGSTGAAFSPTGILLGTYDPVALKLQSYFPAASAKGWVAGCPGPVNVSASTPQTCPTINNYVFNGTSPNLNTWYTGKADYNISSKQKLSYQFQLSSRRCRRMFRPIRSTPTTLRRSTRGITTTSPASLRMSTPSARPW